MSSKKFAFANIFALKQTTWENKLHLARRLILWHNGDIPALLREARLTTEIVSSTEDTAVGCPCRLFPTHHELNDARES
jgi:hypothetical protein